MSMLQRFKDIMSANVNALLDKCEDPSKMVDQLLRNLNDDLGKVKAETAAVMAEETRAKRELELCTSEVNKLLGYAKKAVQAGNDDDARVFLNKKTTLVEKQGVLEQKALQATENATRMRQMHDKLVSQINEMTSRRETIKAKVATANLQDKINKLGSSVDGTSSLSAFAKMEEKANRMLDEANAFAELNQEPVDECETLLKKYAQTSLSIEDELANLKSNDSLVETELASLKSDVK